MHTQLKSINLNLNGRDLCMAGSIILNCILTKEDRRTLIQLIWGLLVGCEHSEDCSCKNRIVLLLTQFWPIYTLFKMKLVLKGLNILIWYDTFSPQWNDWAHCCPQHKPLIKTRAWLSWLNQALIGSWL
jgi:hypothetical protein